MIINDAIKKQIHEIEKHDGYVKPEDLVKQAKPESSPIHECFTWDNEKAGNEYRLWEARQIIVRVTIVDNGKKYQEYQNVRISPTEQAYFSHDKIKTNKSLLSEVIRTALDEIEYWQLKYETYAELSHVINKEKLEKLKKGNNGK